MELTSLFLSHAQMYIFQSGFPPCTTMCFVSQLKLIEMISSLLSDESESTFLLVYFCRSQMVMTCPFLFLSPIASSFLLLDMLMRVMESLSSDMGRKRCCFVSLLKSTALFPAGYTITFYIYIFIYKYIYNIYIYIHICIYFYNIYKYCMVFGKFEWIQNNSYRLMVRH
jgi:hypothetical protein